MEDQARLKAAIVDRYAIEREIKERLRRAGVG